jgi:hypothetical protein
MGSIRAKQAVTQADGTHGQQFLSDPFPDRISDTEDLLMPLRDHFRPPLDDLRDREGFHAAWAVIIVALLPRRSFAEPRVHSGSSAETDEATAATEEAVAGAAAEAAENAEQQRNYIFRGDDNYRSGPAGRALGAEADAADIQNFADHVLRKESNRSSRYVSFPEEVKVARKFTSASDNRYVSKAEMAALRELEARGVIRIWDADQVYASLRAGPKKLAKQAADVRTAMRRNSEILIEGQIPAGILEPTH